MKALGGEGPASPWGARIRGEASRHQCGPGGGVRLCSRRAELQEFGRCLLEGRRPAADLEAGVAAMRVGEAAWGGARTG